MNEIKIHNDYSYLRQFIEKLPLNFDKEGGVLYDKRNTIKVFRVNGANLAVKRFKKPNFFQRLAYSTFWTCKAEKAFYFADRFRTKGFNTPHEVAFIKVWKNGLIKQYYYICEWSKLNSAWSQLVDTLPEYNKEMASDIGKLCAALHANGILHGDLNLSNFLYKEKEDGKYDFELIDINRAKFVDNPSRHLCCKDLMRVSDKKTLINAILTSYCNTKNWDLQQTKIEVAQCRRKYDRMKQRSHRLKKLVGK